MVVVSFFSWWVFGEADEYGLDTSLNFIRQTCYLAAEDIGCKLCKKCWNDCVDQVVVQWVQVKVCARPLFAILLCSYPALVHNLGRYVLFRFSLL